MKFWPPNYANLCKNGQKWQIFGQKCTTFVEHPTRHVWSKFQLKSLSNFLKLWRWAWKNEMLKNSKNAKNSTFWQKSCIFNICVHAMVNILICNLNISPHVWYIRINSNFGSLLLKLLGLRVWKWLKISLNFRLIWLKNDVNHRYVF